MIRRIASILGLLTLVGLSQEEMVSTEILNLALDEPVAGLYFNNGREIASFQANLTGLGEPLAYKGPKRFILRKSAEEFEAKPPLPPPAAAVDLPIDSDRVLLVCVKSNDQPLKLIAYDISKGRIGTGDYRFFNFSHSVISAIFGDRKFAVKPGTDAQVTNPAWKSKVLEIEVELAIINEGKAKSVYTSVWGHRPGRRNFIFLFDGPQTYKPIQICRFFDVPPAANAGTSSNRAP